MKRINAKNIMEKGGLMIEALAMLGLIAVVTPTMYKKSAERTMEIEDINTATTIRTISNAADSFISANYSTILADMTSGNQVMRNINIDDIKPYLPYGFDVEKSLVNYSTPKIGVQRPDTTSNSLTTFVLFPAKADEEEGIGQERTSRIASLIGANGGYTREIESTPAGGGTPTTETIAKGIGGIWALNKDNLNSLFGEDDGSGNKTYSGNINSIVTASSETIDISAAAETNNDKYLQRGLSDGESGEKWRTAMRSDLYMGGFAEDPIYGENTLAMHSIRNIKSLVVGTETPTGDGEYGLYINGYTDDKGSHSAAYIQGALKALGGEFQVKGDGGSKLLGFITKNEDNSKFHFEVDNTSLRYGYKDDSSPYNFEVTSEGNITAQGNITNYGNIELGTRNSGDNTHKSIKIGKTTGEKWLISGSAGGRSSHSGLSNIGTVNILGNDIFSAAIADETTDASGTQVYPHIYMMYGRTPKDEKGNIITIPTYTTSPTFNVEVGSNMKVHGILAAGQLDTNKIRASSLAVGSENVDDAEKWMTVDKDGVVIQDPEWGSNANAKLIVQSSGKKGGGGSGVYYDATGAIDLSAKVASGGIAGISISKPAITGSSSWDSSNDTLEIYHSDTPMSGKPYNNTRRKIVLDSGAINLEADDTKLSVSKEGNVNIIGAQFNVGSGTDIDGDGEEDYIFAVNSSDQKVTFKNAESELTISGADLRTDDGIIIGNTASDKNVMTIDTSTDNTTTEGEPIYIRQGMIDIPSTDGNSSSRGATEGTGIIRASRFVDARESLNAKPLFESIYSKYGASKPYDTYMVNPAYTSVMHDIKLTTRAGARLSDILPDFINKGIYVVRNSYGDDFVSGDFNPTDRKSGDLTPTVIKSTPENPYGTWASPYVGDIPAPQCPPGYGRVVTLAPVSFEVAQSGNIGIHGERRFVKRTSPIATDASGNKVLEPYEFVKGTVLTSGSTESLGVNFKTDSEEKEVTYVIGTNSPNVKPFSVQQSNWLKTHARPEYTDDGFAKSWSAFMGFIYMEKEYGDLIAYLTDENKNPRFAYKEDGVMNIFWNIFPVRRNSLDAYATVYCYFDRSNGMAEEINNNGLVDQYSPHQGYTSYKKRSSDGYIERLNDPTLKYDEAW